MAAWCVCSVIGAVIIVVGLYTVLWGKGRDLDGAAVAIASLPGDEEMNGVVGADDTTGRAPPVGQTRHDSCQRKVAA